LPTPELEAAIGDVDGGRCAQQQRMAVGVPVGALVRRHVHGADRQVVVTIRPAARGRPGQQRLEVGQQQRFVLVDDDGGGGVSGVDVDQTGVDGGAGHQGLEAIGQVDEHRRAVGGDADAVVAADGGGCECVHDGVLRVRAGRIGGSRHEGWRGPPVQVFTPV
jgi:hypothetical protein